MFVTTDYTKTKMSDGRWRCRLANSFRRTPRQTVPSRQSGTDVPLCQGSGSRASPLTVTNIRWQGRRSVTDWFACQLERPSWLNLSATLFDLFVITLMRNRTQVWRTYAGVLTGIRTEMISVAIRANKFIRMPGPKPVFP